MHSNHKIIITGTGRAGTTFLVRLLTELGLDTGYTRDTWQRDYFAHCNAGLEHELSSPGAPYIVKNPNLAATLGEHLTGGQIVIDHAFIPVRDLEAAALSRIRVGGANGNVPGGLLGTDDPARQKSVLAEHFHALVHTLVTHDIPHTFLHFPRFVQDADYAFVKLQPVLNGLDRELFRAAFVHVAEPDLVHTFTPGQPVQVGEARGFHAAERTKRHRRRLRRVIGWTAAAACLSFAIGWHWPVRHEAAPVHASTLLYTPDRENPAVFALADDVRTMPFATPPTLVPASSAEANQWQRFPENPTQQSLTLLLGGH